MPATIIKADQVNLVAELDDLAASPSSSTTVEAFTPGLGDDAVRRAEVDAEIEQAYRDGYEAGAQAATETGVGAVPRLVDSIVDGIAALRRAQTDAAMVPATEILETAMALVEWYIGGAVEADATAITDRVEVLISELIPTAPVVVSVHPSLVEGLSSWAEHIDVTVRGDDGLAPGEARVHAGHADAELTFATARQQLFAALGIDDAGAPQMDALHD